jgi:hypothetical protein
VSCCPQGPADCAWGPTQASTILSKPSLRACLNTTSPRMRQVFIDAQSRQVPAQHARPRGLCGLRLAHVAGPDCQTLAIGKPRVSFKFGGRLLGHDLDLSIGEHRVDRRCREGLTTHWRAVSGTSSKSPCELSIAATTDAYNVMVEMFFSRRSPPGGFGASRAPSKLRRGVARQGERRTRVRFAPRNRQRPQCNKS